jgi:hypothetical protein
MPTPPQAATPNVAQSAALVTRHALGEADGADAEVMRRRSGCSTIRRRSSGIDRERLGDLSG